MEKMHAPLADLLSQAHVALRRDLAELEASAASPRRQGAAAELSARLERTRRHLAEHFRFEEQNGYLDELLKHKPHLARRVQDLLEDHRRLLHALDDLITSATQANELDDALGRQAREWVAQVRRHESRENLLVEDAFNLDIGAED
jgi:hypothetical protein